MRPAKGGGDRVSWGVTRPQAVLKFTAALQAATTSDRPIILRYHEKAGHSAGRGLPFSRRLADQAMELTFLAQELGVGLEAWPD